VPASLIDAANQCVFVPAEAIGATATEQPLKIKQNAKLLGKSEAIRRAASVAMGIAPTSNGRDASACRSWRSWLHRLPCASCRAAGAAADMDIAIRIMSNGQAHRATPLTGALCLAVATASAA
jgi:2-methylaconitate cis-trans-isomerase PrpF